jgi:hypothetical protein
MALLIALTPRGKTTPGSDARTADNQVIDKGLEKKS